MNTHKQHTISDLKLIKEYIRCISLWIQQFVATLRRTNKTASERLFPCSHPINSYFKQSKNYLKDLSQRNNSAEKHDACI